MSIMKKHPRGATPFLEVEYHSTIKLKPAEERILKQYVALISPVFEQLVKENIIKGKSRSLKTFQVSLLLCGDEKVRKLNQEYRGKDKVTDVLSFPAQEDLRLFSPEDEVLHLGDLAISFPQTKKQAREFSIGIWDEFIHLFFHGLIHLLGYDHEVSKKEEKLMQIWESRALDIFSDKKKGSR